MEIGKRIFFDKVTGEVILEIQPQNGIIASVERNIEQFKVLSERNRDTFDVLDLPYGAYAEDFAQCNGYRVNPETLELEFSYPDPNATEPQESVYQKPLTEQLKETQQAVAELTLLLATMNGGM